MSAKITAFFTSSGVPTTGLSPLLTVLDRTKNTEEKTNVLMTEIGQGFYEYIFLEFNESSDYLFKFDGTATLADADRYLASEYSGLVVSRVSVGRGGTIIKKEGLTEEQIDEIVIKLASKLPNQKITIDEKEIKIDDSKLTKAIKAFELIAETKISEIKTITETINKEIDTNKIAKAITEKVETPKVQITTEKLDTTEIQDYMVALFEQITDFLETMISGKREKEELEKKKKEIEEKLTKLSQ